MFNLTIFFLLNTEHFLQKTNIVYLDLVELVTALNSLWSKNSLLVHKQHQTILIT